MKVMFDTNGNERQKDVARLWCDDITTDILYGGSKGSGKSYLGCSLILGNALMYPETYYFIARKTLADLVKFTIPSIHEVFGHWGVTDKYYTYKGDYHFFQFHNGSRVYLIDAKYMPSDPMYERFGSMQMTRGWIEEAGEFSKECKSALGASIGRWKNDDYGLTGKLLMTCNPSNNFLFGDYYKPFRAGKLPTWRKFVQALPTDNKMLPKGYVENLLRTLTASQIARLVHGEWEYDDDPNWLVDYDAICDIFVNDFVQYDGERYISTDLAGKGRDRWVVGTWRGLCCRIPIVQRFSEGKEMETKLYKLSNATKTPRSHIVSDADGLGFYLESYLKGIKEFRGGGRAMNASKYASLKAECAFKLAEYINKRQLRIICSDEVAELIKAELSVLRAKDTDAAERKRDIIHKDRMKELLGRSPDFLDMLIMRMLFEIKTSTQGSTMARIQIPDKR